METEDRIRNRIEAILTNEARNHAEVHRIACEEGILGSDATGGDEDLYLRILNTYRSAIGEVNSRLEENIWFLSGFYRILETIKDQGDFQEICVRVVECVLQEFGAEYCAVSIFRNGGTGSEAFAVEGIKESQRFVRIHSGATLAGSEQLATALKVVAEEDCDGLAIGDAYRDPRFEHVDFPSVIRSLACLSIKLRNYPVGFLALGHSLPQRFGEDHVRVLRILAGLLAHARRLTSGKSDSVCPLPVASVSSPPGEDGILSLVILELQVPGSAGRLQFAGKDAVLDLKPWIGQELSGRELVMLYMDQDLLVLLPDTPAEHVPVRISRLQQAFERWRSAQGGESSAARMEVGYATCRTDEDLASMLEVASAMMHQQSPALSA